MKKRPRILPLFLPHEGCFQACVYCNQKLATAAEQTILEHPDPEELRTIVTKATAQAEDPLEIAFYGCSFNFLHFRDQKCLLDSLAPFIEQGRIAGIRLDVRPDGLSEKLLDFYRSRGASVIELGVQTLNDDILKLIKRGHTAQDAVRAAGLLRNSGMVWGMQLMYGLPGETEQSLERSMRGVIAQQPAFVRIHPTLALPGAELYDWTIQGKYVPLTLDKAIGLGERILDLFAEAEIRVARFGFHLPAEVIASHDIRGPFHPALKSLVQTERMWKRMHSVLLVAEKESGVKSDWIILVPKGMIDSAVGYKRKNIMRIEKRFPGLKVRFRESENISLDHLEIFRAAIS